MTVAPPVSLAGLELFQDLYPQSSGGNIGDVFEKIASGADTYYGTLARINEAKYGSKLAKAQLQAQLAATRASGAALAENARAGLPSSSLLLIGGLGLAALLVLKK